MQTCDTHHTYTRTHTPHTHHTYTCTHPHIHTPHIHTTHTHTHTYTHTASKQSIGCTIRKCYSKKKKQTNERIEIMYIRSNTMLDEKACLTN